MYLRTPPGEDILLGRQLSDETPPYPMLSHTDAYPSTYPYTQTNPLPEGISGFSEPYAADVTYDSIEFLRAFDPFSMQYDSVRGCWWTKQQVGEEEEYGEERVEWKTKRNGVVVGTTEVTVVSWWREVTFYPGSREVRTKRFKKTRRRRKRQKYVLSLYPTPLSTYLQRQEEERSKTKQQPTHKKTTTANKQDEVQ